VENSQLNLSTDVKNSVSESHKFSHAVTDAFQDLDSIVEPFRTAIGITVLEGV
jgi:hypothetical protein